MPQKVAYAESCAAAAAHVAESVVEATSVEPEVYWQQDDLQSTEAMQFL